jgi:hypothetical protein
MISVENTKTPLTLIDKREVIDMKVFETSPGRVNLACDISGRPLTRTNQYGMFCDDSNCECERKSVSMFSDLGNFIDVAAGMFEKGGTLDENALRKAFFKNQK